MGEIEDFGEPTDLSADNRKTETEAETESGINLTVNTNQSNQQIMNVTVNFEEIVEIINESDGSDEQKLEAKEKVEVLKKETKKDSPDWKKVKTVLHWFLDFSQKVFLRVLPIILEKFKNN